MFTTSTNISSNLYAYSARVGDDPLPKLESMEVLRKSYCSL